MWPGRIVPIFRLHHKVVTMEKPELLPDNSLHFILIRSNKMQQYADIYLFIYLFIYLLQNHSTCFGYPSRPSSGVYKTVTPPSGTGHSIWETTFLQRGQIRTGLTQPMRSIDQSRVAIATLDQSILPIDCLKPVIIWPRWRKVVVQIRDMTCTRGCSYSFMYSWWWVR